MNSPSPGTLYTLGTSTRTLEEFLEVLRAWGIAVVCDVRSFPTSRRYPHFSKENLSISLPGAGFRYQWLGELLGGYRQGGYPAYMETPPFLEGLRQLEEIAASAPTAVVCAELMPWRCHRRFIAARMEERGWEVIHIRDAGGKWDWPPPSPGRSLF